MGIRTQLRINPARALLLLPLAISLVGASMAVCAAADSPAPISVATATVRAADGSAAFALDGTIQPVRQATVAAQAAGNVLALAVKAGDRVKTGQLPARIDARDAQAGLARSEAGVAQAEAELRNARIHYERTRELRSQGFVSPSALDLAKTQLDAAQAAAQQAAAGRSQAALARDFTTVTAPFDGLVLATHLEAGDLASPGRPVATIYSPGALRVVVQVPSTRAAIARATRRIEMQLPDGRSIAPAATTALPSADPVSQTVEWRLDLPADALAGLVPGQTVRVSFSAQATPAAGAPTSAGAPTRLAVPASAVMRRGELTAVYVVQDQRFTLRAVRIGTTVGDTVEVLAGLRSGERVALDAVKAGLAGAVPAAQ